MHLVQVVMAAAVVVEGVRTKWGQRCGNSLAPWSRPAHEKGAQHAYSSAERRARSMFEGDARGSFDVDLSLHGNSLPHAAPLDGSRQARSIWRRSRAGARLG